MAEWIPTSERLPEEEGLYIVTFESRAVCDALFRNEYGIKHWEDEYGDKFSNRVIAWMPLPEPYNGGEK